MKTKSILFAALCAGLLGFTSCEDMLTTESTIVMFENDNELNESTDTVYSVLGILQKIQKIADRTVLFGELRGDLTSLNDLASSDLQEISSFTVTNENKYNNPIDYYAVINNCNYYLAHADTAYKKNNDYIFRKEYGVVLSYRAWAYLKLAEAYGKVPFITEPLTNGAKADPALYDLLDIREIARKLIPDLIPFVDVDMPNYGQIDTFEDSQYFFIPVRIMLGELCLWAGEGYYEMAASYLHDYLYRVGNYVTTGYDGIWWTGSRFVSYQDGYSPLFGANSSQQQITFIPMEDEYYDGVTSELDDLFNSTKDNYYFYKATASPAIRELSAAQKCIYYDGMEKEIYYVNPDEMTNDLMRGDLRLFSVLSVDNDITDEKLSSNYNTEKQTLKKINATKICIFRKDLVYLRLAEALNYAGFPESAFAVLKYGLSNQWWEMRDDYISKEEKAKASAKGFINFPYNGPGDGFYPYVYLSATGSVSSNSNTFGIHSRGCGLAEMDTTYVLNCHPDTLSDRYFNMSEGEKVAYLDSVRAEQQIEVEKLLIDELALETAFEGNRFGDLIRFSMHRGERMGCYSDNQFLADRVAARNGSEKIDGSLQLKLKGDGTSYNQAWYLPLP